MSGRAPDRVRRIAPAEAARVRAAQAAWARLGVAFAVAPARRTPDIERLIVETVRLGRAHARLLVMAATWLRRHRALIARHRLARLAAESLGDTERAILGWLLEESGEATGTGERGCRCCREVRAVCRPTPRAQPVFRVHERYPQLLRRLAERASNSARRWNLFAEALESKDDALRSGRWLLEHNPSLRRRALLEGDLRASIVAALEHDPDAGASELELARRCGASRTAVREALARLEHHGIVVRQLSGRRRTIRLVDAA